MKIKCIYYIEVCFLKHSVHCFLKQMWPKVWLHDWHICVLVSNSMWFICNENGCDLLCICDEVGKRLLCIYDEIYSGAWPIRYEFGNIAHFRHHLNFHSLFLCLRTKCVLPYISTEKSHFSLLQIVED